MITQDEMEMFIDGIWELAFKPVFAMDHHPSECTGDSCPIDFGGKENDNN